MTNPFECDNKCEEQYTIEPHGEGYALYYGRCACRHGYNLANMVEPAWNFEPKHIEKMINLGNDVYKHVSKMYGARLGGHEAE
jgi:hypothetical protein